jgi:SAM-dependent methyltransferase
VTVRTAPEKVRGLLEIIDLAARLLKEVSVAGLDPRVASVLAERLGTITARLGSALSPRSLALVEMDLRREAVRRHPRLVDLRSDQQLLHLGCGSRRVEGWLNVDLENADVLVDLGAGELPFPSDHFRAVVSQHLVEHLEPDCQLRPLLAEIRRVLKPGGRLWLSTPDLQKVCCAYLEGRMPDLVAERQRRWRGYAPAELSRGFAWNDFVFQGGEHHCLFDFDALRSLLTAAGFSLVARGSDAEMHRELSFPRRFDDDHSLYVAASA